MLPRRAIQPEGHWRLGFSANHSQGLQCGPLIFVSGQVDLDSEANLPNPGDLAKQTAGSLDYVHTVLAGTGAVVDDLVKLTAFYVSDGRIHEGDLLDHIADCLGPLAGPGPAITLIPLEALAFPGMEIEIEAIAMRHPNGCRLPRAAAWDPDAPRLPAVFSHAVRCGDMLFTSGLGAVDGGGTIAAPSDLAGQSAIMLHRHGVRCGDLVFLGGQVSLRPDATVIHPGDTAAQTRQSMDYIGRVLAGFDLGFEHVVKVNAFYVGSAGEAMLRENAEVRFSYFRETPGPTSTGVPVPYLAYEDMAIEIDVVAMV